MIQTGIPGPRLAPSVSFIELQTASMVGSMSPEVRASLLKALQLKTSPAPVPAKRRQRLAGEEAAFEDWLIRVRPSGDVDRVNDQWLESDEYAELLDPPKPLVAFATDSDIDAVVRWMSRPKAAPAPTPLPVQRVAPMGVMCMREYGDHRLGDFSGRSGVGS